MERIINKNLLKNLANIVTLIRVTLIFVVIFLLLGDNYKLHIWAVMILFFAFLLDGIDGTLARKFKTSNNIGSLVDTLGDRITENVFLVFLAYKRLIPLFIPLVFIFRSFIVDFIRFLAFNRGIGTFLINKSKFGFYIVASKTSRVIYLLLKFLVFLLGAFVIIYPDRKIFSKFSLSATLFHTAIVLISINILRFLLLVFDSRKILKEIFLTKPESIFK